MTVFLFVSIIIQILLVGTCDKKLQDGPWSNLDPIKF